MLSGYAPSAAAVDAVGAIGMDLKQRSAGKPGSFFWGEFLEATVSMRETGHLLLQRRRPLD